MRPIGTSSVPRNAELDIVREEISRGVYRPKVEDVAEQVFVWLFSSELTATR